MRDADQIAKSKKREEIEELLTKFAKPVKRYPMGYSDPAKDKPKEKMDPIDVDEVGEDESGNT